MQEKEFAEFLSAAGKDSALIVEIDGFLAERGCLREISTAKSGYTVSYQLFGHKTLATFVCRKTGVKLRIYPQNIKNYESFLDTVPDKMKKEIIKASVCKRLVNPAACNPKCVTGYDFVMDGERYQKCRYMAFMPSVTSETTPFILEFLEKEIACY